MSFGLYDAVLSVLDHLQNDHLPHESDDYGREAGLHDSQRVVPTVTMILVSCTSQQHARGSTVSRR